MRNVVVGKCNEAFFGVVNRFRAWHRLDWHLGLLNLSAFRDVLRAKNLIDTEQREAPPRAVPVPSTIPEEIRTVRTYDGSYNDLSDPKMGAVNSTFGRTMKPDYRPDLFDRPNPITVSRELMYREAFIPARSLNILAAAWIQFQVHDWVNHRATTWATRTTTSSFPCRGAARGEAARMDRRSRRCGSPATSSRTMRPTATPVFRNITTPWWDGSEVYGDTKDKAKSLRDKGAFIRLDDGYLPKDVNGVNVTGFNESWWLGLSMMHTLFAREHNVLCQELLRAYPDWLPERVYQTARLIISALIAKIHTVEWTPAILATKTIEVGLRANWYGAPKDWLSQLGIWLLDAHALKGIPQTLPNHHAAPYSLTEEFASVYRLHPLIPDDYPVLRQRDRPPHRNAHIQRYPRHRHRRRDASAAASQRDLLVRYRSSRRDHTAQLPARAAEVSARRTARSSISRWSTSCATAGAACRASTTSAPRCTGRGSGTGSSSRTTTGHRPQDPRSLPIDRQVDTMVGLHAEPPPEGFGFSDTAFRVFILMASRRLQSDRFLTVDYRPEVYSPLGLDWIDKNGMTSIILRHCPQLSAVLPRTASAFAPFRPIAA